MKNYFNAVRSLLTAKTNKQLRFYCFAELLAAILFCLLPAESLTAKTGQLLLFLLLGCVNLWLLNKASVKEPAPGLQTVMLLAMLQFIVMLLLLLVLPAIFTSANLRTAFTGSAAFFLPVAIHFSWKLFAEIPHLKPSPWYLSADEPGHLNFSRQSMLVQLQVKPEPGAPQANTYPLTVSAKWKLGKVFEKLIAETKQAGWHTSISTKDKQEQPYGWQFIEIKWLGFYRRFLDPSVSLLANKLKANAKIIIVRAAMEQ